MASARLASVLRLTSVGLGAFCLACATPRKPGAQPPSPSAGGDATVARAPSRALPLDPRVVSGTLDNGLGYYLAQRQTRDRRAHLVLAVKAGSLYEDDDQRGLAHFVEHMAFNGSRRFERGALVDFFERSGLRFGSHANASTSFDRAQYMLSIPTDDPTLLATALDVLEDWAGALSFEPAEVDKERAVLLSEWTSSRGAARRVGEQQRQLLFAGSRFAEREVIGDKAVLESGPRQRLVDFYRRWYRPDRMAVVVVGDIDPGAVRAAITERFSRLAPSPARGVAAENPVYTVPRRAQPVAAVITDPETPATVVSVVFEAPTQPVRTESAQRELLGSMLAVSLLGKRLDELARDPSAPFTATSSRLSPGAFGCLDVIELSARAKEGKAQAVLEVLLLELERVRRHGFTEPELERVAEEVRRGLEHALEAEPTAEASSLALALADHFITGNVVTSAAFDLALGSRLLGEITASELAARVQAWSTESTELLLVSGAARDALPAQASLLATRAAIAGRPVAPYRQELAPQPLLPALPEPGRVVSEERVPELGVAVWSLSNGARVVLKATDFKDDQILMRATSFGGDSLASDGDYPSARFATPIVAASGAGALDQQALTRALAGKVASARPFIDEQNEGIGGEASPRDLESLLQLTHLLWTAPRRDPQAFEAFRGALREGLRNRDLSPQLVFLDAVSREVWGDSPRRAAPTLASVEALDLDRALGFYRQRFADASDATVVFVGDIDEARLRPLVERYLASLPATSRKERFKDLGLRRRSGITRVKIEAGREDKATIVQIFHGETPWSEPAHTDLVSLTSYLSIRLREVLREELGGVYTPAVSSEFVRVPHDAHTLTIRFECKAVDIAKLEAAKRRVLAEVKERGVPDTYLTKLINQRTRDLEESFRDNGFWLGRLASKYQLGEDPREILKLHELTRRITSENIRLAARKYLRDDQYVDARLLPAASN